MQRPPGFMVTTCLVGIMHVLTLFLVQWHLLDDEELYATVGIIVVLGSLVLWWYWRGFIWARWVVLLESFWFIWNLKAIPRATRVEMSMMIAEGVLAAFFLVYLNTKPVRAWFEGTA